MKRYTSKLRGITSALLGATLLATCGFARAGGNTIVSGSYSITGPNLEFVDFQVIQKPDGTVTGEVHDWLLVEDTNGNSIGYFAHLRIDCLEFLDENTVLLTGVDVLDSNPNYTGDTVGFVVRDNGEGQDAAPDQATFVYYGGDVGFDITCQAVLDLIGSGGWDFEADLHSAETGNIQVKP